MIETIDNGIEVHRVLRPDLEIVGNLQGDEVSDLNATILDVGNDLLREREHVRRDEGDLLGTHQVQRVHQCARAGDHACITPLSDCDLAQSFLRDTVVAGATGHDRDQARVAHDIDLGIGELDRAAI